jgi:PAS domain-containing protein
MAKKSPPRPEQQEMSTQAMAGVLGLTTRRLQIMVKEGIVPSLGRGRFRLCDVVQAYAGFLKEGADRKAGSDSLDRVREERALEIQMNRLRKDRELISLEEAVSVVDQVTGLFVASLNSLPAQITGVPRERQRLNDIFDAERQRLADHCLERRRALLSGRTAADPSAEDDAA